MRAHFHFDCFWSKFNSLTIWCVGHFCLGSRPGFAAVLLDGLRHPLQIQLDYSRAILLVVHEEDPSRVDLFQDKFSFCAIFFERLAYIEVIID